MIPQDLLIIFTRNPERGKVKTRLAKTIGDEAAYNIYNFLLRHTMIVTKDIEVKKLVYYSDYIPKNDIWDEGIYTKRLQRGNDLGQRMNNAFEEGFQNGYKNIIIIGSDLYDLASEDLVRAFEGLKTYEYVVGPSYDGGYYLMGMNRSTPELFLNKKWSTQSVLEDTLSDLKNRSLLLLEERNDIDTYKDIKEHTIFHQFLDSKNDKSNTGNSNLSN